MGGDVTPPKLSPRVLMIERARCRMLASGELEREGGIVARDWGALGLVGLPVPMVLQRLQLLCMGIQYRRDRYSENWKPGLEVVQRPVTTIVRGGDCEDFMLLAGGVCLALGMRKRELASVYTPNAEKPGHVMLGVGDWVLDAIPGANGIVQRADVRGSWIPWSEKF